MTGIAEIVEAVSAGAEWTSYFHKTGVPASITAGLWGDLSMAAGTPKYNAYVGPQGEFTALVGAGNDGIYVPDAGSATTYLMQATVAPGANPAQATWILADYLGFYALIDGDSTDQQDMVNAVPVPRAGSGRVALICAAPMAATGTGTITYTNQDGVAGRVATFNAVWSSNVGTLVASSSNAGSAGTRTPWLGLQGGDTGVSLIEAITFSVPPGGFMHAVIMRPITTVVTTAAASFSEKPTIQHAGHPPIIEDGAYLNWLCLSGSGTLAAPVRGSLSFAWC